MNALFKLNWSSYLPFQEKGGGESPTSHFLWRHCHLKCNRSPRPYQAANKNEPWMTWFPKIRFGYLKSSYPIKFFIKNFMPRTGWRELIRKHFKLAWFLSENTCKTIVRFFLYISHTMFLSLLNPIETHSALFPNISNVTSFVVGSYSYVATKLQLLPLQPGSERKHPTVFVQSSVEIPW